jgi:hypothetical protein
MSNTNVVNVITTTESPNRIIITSARAPGVQQFLYQVQVFTVPGTLNTGVGRARFYIPGPITLSNVRASVSNAPLGGDIIVDVNVNGSTVFTNQLSRPKILAGSITCPTATPNIQELTTGDYLSVDIDQIGSIFAGSDLTVQIELTP